MFPSAMERFLLCVTDGTRLSATCRRLFQRLGFSNNALSSDRRKQRWGRFERYFGVSRAGLSVGTEERPTEVVRVEECLDTAAGGQA